MSVTVWLHSLYWHYNLSLKFNAKLSFWWSWLKQKARITKLQWLTSFNWKNFYRYSLPNTWCRTAMQLQSETRRNWIGGIQHQWQRFLWIDTYPLCLDCRIKLVSMQRTTVPVACKFLWSKQKQRRRKNKQVKTTVKRERIIIFDKVSPYLFVGFPLSFLQVLNFVLSCPAEIERTTLRCYRCYSLLLLQ